MALLKYDHYTLSWQIRVFEKPEGFRVVSPYFFRVILRVSDHNSGSSPNGVSHVSGSVRSEEVSSLGLNDAMAAGDPRDENHH